MPPTWTVEPVQFDQLTEWTEGVYAAFRPTDNELVNALDPAGHLEGAVARHRHEMRAQPDERCIYLQVYDHDAKRIAGGAQWAFYQQDPQKPAHVDVTWLGEEQSDEKAYAQDVLDALHHSRVTDYTGPHAMLRILFTNPGYQHKGVGAALVEWGCRKADDLGLKCFLESSPMARHFYPKFGFVETKTCEFTWERWSHKAPVKWYQMMREARGNDHGTVGE